MSESKDSLISPFKPRGRLLCFGDSLTQEGCSEGGWVSLLQNWYTRKWDVLNRGYSGYNTNQAKYLLTLGHIVEQNSRIQLAFIFFGANDASLKDINPAQHVPLENYSKNLKQIIQYFKETVGCKVLVICPPPMSEDMWDAHCRAQGKPEKSRLNSVTGEYAKAAQSIAVEEGVPFLNLWDEFQTARPNDWTTLLSDGLHFTKEGNGLLFKLLSAKIISEFPEFDPTKIVLDAPLWRELDQEKLQSSWTSAPSLT
jgi:lysophospholipase L1-like esterase